MTRSQAVVRIADRILPHSRLSSNHRLLLSSISSCFRDITLEAYWGHEFDLSARVTWRHRSRDYL